MENEIIFDEFLESSECEQIFESFQQAIKLAFAEGYKKGICNNGNVIE